MEPLAVRPSDAFSAIGVGNTKGWELVAAGELESFKVGAGTRITTASLRGYVARRLAEARQAA